MSGRWLGTGRYRDPSRYAREVFTRPHPATCTVVSDTRAGLRNGTRQNPGRAQVVLQSAADRLAAIYRTPPVEVIVDPDLTPFACYFPEREVIVMRRPSVVTLFHEFRHHHQNHPYGDIPSLDRSPLTVLEMDAYSWSLSVVWRTSPVVYDRAGIENPTLAQIAARYRR